jgi:hypothetical protein
MRRALDRRRLLVLGASGTAAALAWAGSPARADLAPDTDVDVDVARMRLLATVELVELAYADRALANEELLHPGDGRVLRTMRASELDHYTTLAAVLGPEAPVADDYAIGFATNAFGSRPRILATGVALQQLATAIAIGTLADVARADLRLLAGQLTAVESTHEAALRRAAGLPTPRRLLPTPLDAARATDALHRYLVG